MKLRIQNAKLQKNENLSKLQNSKPKQHHLHLIHRDRRQKWNRNVTNLLNDDYGENNHHLLIGVTHRNLFDDP